MTRKLFDQAYSQWARKIRARAVRDFPNDYDDQTQEVWDAFDRALSRTDVSYPRAYLDRIYINKKTARNARRRRRRWAENLYGRGGR